MSFDKMVKGKRKNTRILEIPISQSNIDAQVAAFLYAVGYVHDNEEITSLDYGDLGEIRTVKVEIYKKPEVKKTDKSKESAGLS